MLQLLRYKFFTIFTKNFFFELLFIVFISSIIFFFNLSELFSKPNSYYSWFFWSNFFRLMPSFVKLISNFNTIRFATSGYKVIYDELKDIKKYTSNIQTLKL